MVRNKIKKIIQGFKGDRASNGKNKKTNADNTVEYSTKYKGK
jgi:hypothetical protein